MKKIYILASAVVLASVVSAQKVSNSHDSRPVVGEESNATVRTQINKKTPGDIFWYEDFENGIGGNAVDGSGNPIAGDIFWTRGDMGSGYATVWQHDFDGPNGSFEVARPLLSESGSNGWMIFDANYQTDQDNPGGFITIDGYLESPTIDVNAIGTTNLGIEIQHAFRTCCSGSAYPVDFFVGYFDNGVGDWVWTSKATGNTAHNTRNASLTSTGYNVETRMFNVSDVAANAAANTGEMRMRFYWNSDINASNSYYMWMVDDIRVKEISLFDSQLDDMYTGDIVNDFEYFALPDGQITSYTAIIGGDVTNMGASNLTDAGLDISITNPSSVEVYSGSTPTATLNAGAAATTWFDTGFIPNAGDYGDYMVTVTSVHTEADQVPTNNSKTKYFSYTEFEMGHWNPYTAGTSLDVVNSGSDPGRVMQFYLAYQDATVYGISIYLNDSGTTPTTIGQFAFVGIYDAADGVTELAFQEFEVTSNMIGQPVSIMFDTPFQVFTGDGFYAGLGSYGGGDNLYVARDPDGDLDNSALIDINGTIYGDSGDDYVNLWFDVNPMPVGTNNVELSLNTLTTVPNPAAYSTEVRYSVAANANVSLEVTDVTGKIVMTENLGSKAAGNHTYELNTANLADGIYYYTLVAGQDRLTNKLVVRK